LDIGEKIILLSAAGDIRETPAAEYKRKMGEVID
jgi:hypothetical protein